MPIIIPAQAQAAITARAPFAPFSKAFRRPFGPNLDHFLSRLTTSAAPIAQTAAIMGDILRMTMTYKRTTRGIIRCPPSRNTLLLLRISSLLNPRSPLFSASRWTAIRTVPKYRMAGINAARIIVVYGIPVISAMTKAAAPIIGGISCPPVEAPASTAPANWGE